MRSAGIRPCDRAVRWRRRGGRLLVGLLRALPVSSERLGPPKGYHRRARDWVERSGAGRYEEVWPAETTEHPPPRTVEPRVPWEFGLMGGMTHTEPPDFVVEIPGGRILGQAGCVIAPDDRVLFDVSRAFDADPERMDVLAMRKLPSMTSLRGAVAVLATRGSETYWHWLFEALPRYELLRRSSIGVDGIDWFVTSPLRLPFQQATVRALGIPEGRAVSAHPAFHAKADRLIVPSFAWEIPKRWVCDFVRTRLLIEPGRGPGRGPRRLYVARGDAAKRRVINEREVIDRLRRFGFEPVSLTDKSVTEQARLFAGAEVIVAAHGSGLVNLVFCDRGTQVIEVFSPRYVNPCFWMLGSKLGLEYYFLLGEGSRLPAPPADRDPQAWFDAQADNTADLVVNTETLLATLEKVGIDTP